ncbi:hypothetical protein H4S00_004993, partial [Coemansia sp. D1744]
MNTRAQTAPTRHRRHCFKSAMRSIFAVRPTSVEAFHAYYCAQSEHSTGISTYPEHNASSGWSEDELTL